MCGRGCSAVFLVVMAQLFPFIAVSQSMSGTGRTEYKESYSESYSHRLFISPSVDLVPGLTADVNAGLKVGYYLDCCFDISPAFSAGIAPIDSILYIEAGFLQLSGADRKGYKFPIHVDIRGDVLRTDLLKLGLGYQYRDVYYRFSDYDNPRYNSFHWFYSGVAYTPGNHIYTLNAGPRLLDQKIVGMAVSVGASFPMGTYYSFLIDIFTFGDVGGGLWTGIRYHSSGVRIDVATILGLVWLFTVGIPIS